MGRKWATRRKTSKDKPQLIYELICVLIVISALIYAAITGTAPDNSGF